MATVYIVVSGSYSDYQYHCAFTDEKVAQQYCDTYNTAKNDYYDRMTVDLLLLDDPDQMKTATSGKMWWTVWVLPDGDSRVFPETATPPDKSDRMSDKGHFTTRVYCKDRERAVKVAQERLMQHKARLAGIG